MAASSSPQQPTALQYRGPKDVGRSESLYRSAMAKADLDYSAQLLFLSLVANPEHEEAFGSILGKMAAFAAAKRKMVVRVSDMLNGAPADAFIKSLSAYASSARPEDALAAAVEAHKAGLAKCAVVLGRKVLGHLNSGDAAFKAPSLLRLIAIFESCRALEDAVAAVRHAVRLFPEEHAFREREKNLLASKYLSDTDIAESAGYREQLRNRDKQEAMHRPQTQAERVDEAERRYLQTRNLEDFRELMRGLRESAESRRLAAISTLEDGLQRFGEKETRWFIREIRIEQQWRELRQLQQVPDGQSGDEGLNSQQQTLRKKVLSEEIDHLYEIVTSLPNTPERQRRQHQLAGKLFQAGRFEEAIKQAQLVRRQSDNRLDAWIIMAKSFVQLGLTPEASECFQNILGELNASTQGSVERVLEAKYAYAEFLAQEAEKSRDPELARQARKLCSDVMIDDINYRDIRSLAARIEALAPRSDRSV